MQDDALTIRCRGGGGLRLPLSLLCGCQATRGSVGVDVRGVALWRATILTQLLVRRLRAVGWGLLAVTAVRAHDCIGCDGWKKVFIGVEIGVEWWREGSLWE
jgi:hypothetical protein